MSANVAPVESDLGRFYSLFPVPDLARDLFNIVEGHRVDARLRAAYPGIRRDMTAIATATLERRGGLSPTLTEAEAVVEGLVLHSLGLELDLSPIPPAVANLVATAVAMVEPLTNPAATVGTSATVTAQLYELIDDGAGSARPHENPFTPDPGAESQPQNDAEDDRQSPPENGPGGGANDYSSLDLPPFMTPVLEELIKQRADELAQDGDAGESEDAESPDGDGAMSTQQAQQEGQQAGDETAQRVDSQPQQVPASPGEAPDALSDDQEGGGAEMELGPAGDVPLVATDDDEAEEDLGEQTFFYDEWDHKIEDYRPAWCTLREQRATRVHEGFVAATFHEHGGVVSQIRRNFQLMRPERLRKMRFQPDGDDLDLDGLVEHVVDRRARVSPTERVYIKRDKKDRDVATAFLVDMSSSTDRKIDGRKRIIDIEKESLLLMCEALEAIRDEYAIFGFSGSGRDDCQFYTVKAFGERYDARVKGRIGGIYGRQKTRMGPALRHATKQLMAVDAHVKLMILLTDGKPYDSDTYQDNTYAQEDTKMALREARREKIHLFCVTVDQEGADYLPHMYSDANFVVVDDVRTLPQKLPQLYRRLTS
jgi:nitric oxide reductase NorD protein